MHKSDKGAPDMRGYNQRNQDGELRKVREDTKAGTLEDRYGADFNVRRDMEWGELKKRLRVYSVKEALYKARKR